MGRYKTAFEWLYNTIHILEEYEDSNEGFDYHALIHDAIDYTYVKYKNKDKIIDKYKKKYDVNFFYNDDFVHLDVINHLNKKRNITYNFDFKNKNVLTLNLNKKDGLKVFNDLANYIAYYYIAMEDFDSCCGDEFSKIVMYKKSIYKYDKDILLKLREPNLVIAYSSSYDKKLDESLLKLADRFDKKVKFILITPSRDFKLSASSNTFCSL